MSDHFGTLCIKGLTTGVLQIAAAGFFMYEVVYVTIGNPAFCLPLNLTGVHFWDELQHFGDVNEPETKYRPIRTREIGGTRLSEELYAIYNLLVDTRP